MKPTGVRRLRLLSSEWEADAGGRPGAVGSDREVAAQVGGDESLDDSHPETGALCGVEPFGNVMTVVEHFDRGDGAVPPGAKPDGTLRPILEAVADRVRDELVDGQR